MSGPSRRRILQAGGAAIAVGLAGCGSPSEDDGSTPDGDQSGDGIRLAEIKAANHDTEQPHTVRLLIRDDDSEIVYWRAEQLDPAENEGRVNSSRLGGLPEAAGEYELIVRLDDTGSGAWKRIDTAELTVPCLTLSIDVMDPDENEDLSLYYAIDPDCESKTDTGN